MASGALELLQHKKLPEPGKPRVAPAMEVCTSCHNHPEDFAEANCTKCHADLKTFDLLPVTAFSHQGDWLRVHGSLSRGSAATCATCHDQTFCAECHAAQTTPLRPSIRFPESVERSFIHRGDYVSRHMVDAGANPASCARCHGTAFCSACHTLQGLTSQAANVRDPHPAGWTAGTAHGRAARNNILACAIQTDAAINQGNSGGPLVNLAGEVIGVNTLIVRQSSGGTIAEGLGFAIPVNTAQAIAQQIIEQGYFARPYMGINYQPVNPTIAARYGLPVQWGVYITSVEPGSPASAAGLQEGDIITTVGDVALDQTHSYVNALFAYSPGVTIPLVVMRGGSETQLQITLGEAQHR